jgi:hypothetical protein
LWRDVSTPDIKDFLSKFKTVPKATRVNATNIVRYIEDSLNDPKGSELTKWNVGVIGRNMNEELGAESFGLDVKIGRISRSLDKANTTSIGTLITPLTEDFNKGDELLDFTDDMRQEALAYKAKGLTSANAARSARDAQQGLLLVYPLSPFEIKTPGDLLKKKSLGEALGVEDTIVGLAIAFPHSNLDHTSRQFWQQ